MRPRRERAAVPFQPRSSVAGVLAEARASLLNPSRPYTPAGADNRHLLDARHSSYESRPSSAFNFKEF
eukprot:SAG11_NODE_5417_length_1566_cov_0.912747_1_plen_67_part_01